MVNIEDLASRLKRLRKIGGYTIDALALKAGISSHTIKDIEANRTSGGLKSLSSLAKALGVPIEYLEHGEGGKVEVEKAPQKIAGPSKILSMYMAIPDDIVQLAQRLDKSNSEAWASIRSAMENEIKIQDKKKPAAKKA